MDRLMCREDSSAVIVRAASLKCIATLALGGMLVTACANRPESIHASYVSYEKYMDLDCPAMAREMVETRAQLERYSKLQNEKANGDAVGVFLLGIPFSKLSGDVEGDVARLKGEVEALDTAEIKKKCASPPGSVTASAAPPVPPPPPVKTIASSTPATTGLVPSGAAWSYRYVDKIYGTNDEDVVVKVISADDRVVDEQVSAASSSTQTMVVTRHVDAKTTRFDALQMKPSGDFVEFAPYLLAAGGEQALAHVTDATGYPEPSFSGWTTHASAPVWEQVSVPAASFRALRLKITGTGEITDSARLARQKFVFRVWYVPEVKRYVRMEHEIWHGWRKYSHDEVELTSFKLHS